MKCASCKTTELEPMELENGLLAAGCKKCDGALLPLMNYRFWSENIGDIEAQGIAIAEEVKGAKQCPKCQRIMTKFNIEADTKNKLELCTHCDEVWMDAGEWELIKSFNLADKLSAVFTQSWQRNIRKQKQANSIKQHYRDLLGEESFLKLDDFKQWIDSHPNRADIKHYVTINFLE